MKRFNISLPENIKKQNSISVIKRRVSEINPKLGVIMVAVAQLEPCTVTDIRKVLISEHNLPIARSTLFRYLEELECYNVLQVIEGSKAVMVPTSNSPDMKEEDKTDLKMIENIKNKYLRFMENYEGGYKKRYKNIRYFWISAMGVEIVEWVCEKFGYNTK